MRSSLGRVCATALILSMMACADADRANEVSGIGSAMSMSPATTQEVCLSTTASLAAVDAAAACARSDSIDDALSVIGTNRCNLGVSPSAALDARGFLRTASLSAAMSHPLSFVTSMQAFGTELDRALETSTPVANAIALAGTLDRQPTSLCATFSGRTLRSTLAERDLVAAADASRARLALASVPSELDVALGPIVGAIADAAAVVRVATPQDPAARTALQNYSNWILWSAPSPPTEADLALVAKVDVAALSNAAARLALVIERTDLSRFRGLSIADVVIPTKLGDIVLRGPHANVDRESSARPIALLLDTGGDDVVRSAAGGASLTQPVSVLVDLAGADHYGYAETDAGSATRLPSDSSGRLDSGRTKSRTPRQGGAFLGIGLTFDYGGGADDYRSLALSQGAGVFGVGALYDDGGDDEYAAETLSQGAAIDGVGVLIDASGTDTRRIFARGQGYGASAGVGILLDGAGADHYRADPGDASLGGELLYPSDLLSGDKARIKGNHNAVQGCGEGRRGLGDGIAAGGIGVLRDRAGDDRYEAGAFAQGCSLEEGIGALLDAQGEDHYDALAYAQGAGIHRGIGLIADDRGDDCFNCSFPVQATSLGVGHDFGVGVVLDGAGRDEVHAPTLSLGSGSANGLGLFAAEGGDDTFAAASAAAFGASLDTEPQRKEPTTGVFVKAGDRAEYRIANRPVPYAGSLWHASRGDGRGMIRSVGLDAPKGRVAR